MIYLGIIIVLFFFHLIRLIRKNNIDLKFALLWLLFGFLSLIPVLFGEHVSKELIRYGFMNPGFAVAGIAIILLSIISLYLTIAISRLNTKQEELILKVAIYEQKSR
jgi:hypothetical protein